MHTNFDILGMADLSGDFLRLSDREVLEVTFEEGNRREGIGRIGSLPKEMTLRECALFVKEQFQLPHVIVYGNPDTGTERAAVCTGSGKESDGRCHWQKAQVYITGDVDYHPRPLMLWHRECASLMRDIMEPSIYLWNI